VTWNVLATARGRGRVSAALAVLTTVVVGLLLLLVHRGGSAPAAATAGSLASPVVGRWTSACGSGSFAITFNADGTDTFQQDGGLVRRQRYSFPDSAHIRIVNADGSDPYTMPFSLGGGILMLGDSTGTACQYVRAGTPVSAHPVAACSLLTPSEWADATGLIANPSAWAPPKPQNGISSSICTYGLDAASLEVFSYPSAAMAAAAFGHPSPPGDSLQSIGPLDGLGDRAWGYAVSPDGGPPHVYLDVLSGAYSFTIVLQGSTDPTAAKTLARSVLSRL